ncbi:MAG: sugar O-acetyltransferase [Clostridia bacterium]|nr:sugar O-acetyltransferase [Clostridia bacterium]
MNNIERRDAQMAYISDKQVMEEQIKSRKLLQKLNFMDRGDFAGIAEVVKELLGSSDGAMINPPFYCDYGSHIHVGRNFFANYNCTIIDVAKVIIGDNCQMAPNVAIYTAGHPVYPDTRNTAYEYGKEVRIGNNVWIGGNTVICPGVTIGDCCVIGAGSVVTKDIPAWTVAVGNPCRVIRKITEADRRLLFRIEEIDDEAWQHICTMNGLETTV